jgi:hypothetical protein
MPRLKASCQLSSVWRFASARACTGARRSAQSMRSQYSGFYRWHRCLRPDIGAVHGDKIGHLMLRLPGGFVICRYAARRGGTPRQRRQAMPESSHLLKTAPAGKKWDIFTRYRFI